VGRQSHKVNYLLNKMASYLSWVPANSPSNTPFGHKNVTLEQILAETSCSSCSSGFNITTISDLNFNSGTGNGRFFIPNTYANSILELPNAIKLLTNVTTYYVVGIQQYGPTPGTIIDSWYYTEYGQPYQHTAPGSGYIPPYSGGSGYNPSSNPSGGPPPTSSPPPPPISNPPPTLRKNSNRERDTLIILGTIALVLLVGAGVYYLFRRQKKGSSKNIEMTNLD